MGNITQSMRRIFRVPRERQSPQVIVEANSAADVATRATPPKIDPFAVGYEDLLLTGWFNPNTEEVAPGFPVSAADVVVDVGCGDGGIASFCAGRGAHVVLADSDAMKIQRVSENPSMSHARKIEILLADANSLPLPDKFASRVVCTEVLEHVDDPSVVVSELARIGQPGALYLISVPGALSEHLQEPVARPSHFEKPNHIRIFDGDSFRRLVEGAGLQIERQTSQGFFWAMWWLFAWEFADGNPSRPLLDAWTNTWLELLKTQNGAAIKQGLDAAIPKQQVIIARKPV